ncbi:MAG: metallophosphoesterase family protein [Thermoleophilia bacterium]|nr:metallophosphoesterase family protein [Thermoleophilia bacterium]
MGHVRRVGVVADTHVGDLLPRLPRGVLDALDGVELILHAGDLTAPRVLDELRQVAPVVAVQGNHDRAAGLRLPEEVTLTLGDVRIGLVHGDRSDPWEAGAIAASFATGSLHTAGLERQLARRFRGADVVVFGHLHAPLWRTVGGTLVFSPGAVHTMEAHARYMSGSPRARAYRRWRRLLPPEAADSRVGIVEVRGRSVTARSVAVQADPASSRSNR